MRPPNLGSAKEPVESVRWLDVDSLKANHYNPNRVMNAEMNLIERSILKTGWIQPILVNGNNVIIDGFHRWTLSRLSTQLRERFKGKVPCCVLDVSDVEAMIITVRINRAKGTHLAFRMADYMKEIVQKHKVPIDDLAKDIGATMDEVQMLMQSDIYAARNIKDWQYSKAWYPAESGRTRLPTLFDMAGGKEVIKNADEKKAIEVEDDDVLFRVTLGRRRRKKFAPSQNPGRPSKADDVEGGEDSE